MKLRGVEFGNVFCAAGARNFFGTEADAYWFHQFWLFRAIYWLVSLVLRRPWGLNYTGSTFVTKTTTVMPHEGNMPRDFFPRCVIAKFWGGYTLNKVGLSGPGANWLLEQGLWQKRDEPFFISFMAVSDTMEDRLEELRHFVMMLHVAFVRDEAFRSRVALEINLSCPNVGMAQSHVIEEATEMKKIFEVLGIPVGFKLSVEMAPEIAAEIAMVADFLTASNTVAFGRLPDKIDWKHLFGSDVSPLASIGPPNSGGGGLSGKPLLPHVIEWLRILRTLNPTIPIIAGGGVLTPDDAEDLLYYGANAVFIGCASILRPWRVANIIHLVNETCCKRK